MAVPRQFVVNSDSNVLNVCGLFQGLAVYIVGRLYDLAFVCNPDVFTFICVEHHLLVFFPFLKLV